MSERHLVGTNRDPTPTCKEFLRSVVVLNDVCRIAVIDFECVSSRVLLVKFKFSSVKMCCMVLLRKILKKGRGSGMTWTGFL